MEFSILGPLEVRHEGEPVPIPGRHAPKLLAVLLLNAGHTVTIAQLVETLWDAQPPATARRQVQNVMAALRRAIPVPDVIESRTNGYRLVLDGVCVDHRRFRRLRAASRGAEPREALRSLRDALRLWRGRVLAGITGGVIEAAAVKLEEERLATVEDRIELEFALRQYGDAVAELRELAQTYPYRQRLTGLLMRGLWHSGRSPEAVTVYEQLSARLADDLGLCPGPDLTRLYARISGGGPPPTPSKPSSDRPVPAQLPAAPSTFTGRGDQVAELDDLLEQDGGAAVVSAIAGMGGAGKTALALHWGHRVRNRFPDGQLYINLRGYDEGEPVKPIEALGRFLVALGQSSASVPTDVESASAIFRSLVAQRRMLVVLDNARTVEQVQPLLPGGAANFAVVTSRERMDALSASQEARLIRLGMLSHIESVELLAAIVGKQRLDDELKATHDLVRLCGHLPLALRIAGAQIVSDSSVAISEFTSQLDRNDKVDRLAIGDDNRAAVAHSLELSYKSLTEEQRLLLQRLALVPGTTFCRSLAFHLSGYDGTNAQRTLSKLIESNFVELHGEDRFRLHDLIRAFVLSRGGKNLHIRERAQTQTRLIEWYDSHIDALPADEGANVVAAFTAWEHDPQAWKLARVAATFWRKGISPTALLGICQRALPAARNSDFPYAVPLMYHSIAIIHRGIGKPSKAVEFARKALDAAESSGGDPTGLYHSSLAVLIDEIGKVSESVPLLRLARHNAIQSNNRRIMMDSTAALGNAYRILGEFSESEHFLRQAIALSDADYPEHDVDVPRFQLGVLFMTMGRFEEAIAICDRTIADADQISSVRYQIRARIRRATIARTLGDYKLAHQLLLQAMDMSVLHDHESLVIDTHIELADLLHYMGEPINALAHLRDLPQHDSDDPDIELRANSARIRGLINSAQGETTIAITLLTYAHDLYTSMPSPLMQARVLASLGSAYRASGDITAARRHHVRALDIFTRLGVPEADEVRRLLVESA